MSTGRLASRVSVALLRYSKPAHKYVPLSPNGLTRSFILSSRVAYAPEQTEIKQKEDHQASEKKPKKARKTEDASKSEAEKPKRHVKKQESSAKLKPKSKPVIIAADLLPPPPPATPYSRFLKDWHSKRTNSPSIEIGSQAKDIAAEWHALSESGKQPYTEGYRAEREIYMKKRQEWFDNVDPVTLRELNKVRKRGGKKKFRNPTTNPNKKPLTPFLLFAAEYRLGQDVKLGVPEGGRRAGEAWRALSETEKQQYLDRYKNEMDAWRERNATAASA